MLLGLRPRQNPHTNAGDANRTLSVVSAVTKLTVTSVDSSNRRRLDASSNETQNMTVAMETPIDPILSYSAAFAEPEVQMSFQINCTKGL